MRILVYSPFANIGHFSAYNVLYCRALIAAGCDVVLLTREGDGALKLLAEEFAGLPEGRLALYEYMWPHRTVFDFRLRRYGADAASEPHQAISDAFAARYPEPRPTTLACLRGSIVMEAAAALEQMMGAPIDHVLLMYMDMIDMSPAEQGLMSQARYPWSGLLIGPRMIRDPANEPEPFVAMDRCAGVLVLDEAFARPYELAGKFHTVWDLVNAEVPPAPSALGAAILEKARGRKIVFLGGCIAAKKHLREFVDMARLVAPADELFFACVGEILLHSFTPEDRAVIEAALADVPENMFFHKAYVDAEEDFNDIVRLSDLIYVVHRNFPFSSNILIKAATFGKPSLGMDEGFVGRSIRNYELGAVVASPDPVLMLQAINDVLARESAPGTQKDFLARHSEANLRESLRRWVAAISGQEDKAMEQRDAEHA